jgi:uncharacterized protein (DUF1778 family)
MATKKVFPVRLNEEQHSLLENAAYSEGKSKHQFILDAIDREAKKEAETIRLKKLLGRTLDVLMSGEDKDKTLRQDLMNFLINS